MKAMQSQRVGRNVVLSIGLDNPKGDLVELSPMQSFENAHSSRNIYLLASGWRMLEAGH